MKVAISTTGRFHLFALARELDARGCLGRIYSGFIWSVLAREGVARDKVTTFPWFRTPYMALGRLNIPTPAPVGRWLEMMSCVAQDTYVAGVLPPCDAFVGHDGVGLNTGKTAQRRGSLYIADSGTSHVRARRNLLLDEFARNRVSYEGGSERIFHRQLDEYAQADGIVVPSTAAKQSFVTEGVSADKVFVVPYGVRIENFSPVPRPRSEAFRVLFVGSFSIRKGARYLLEAFYDFRHPRKELLIVGDIQEETRPFISSMGTQAVRFLGHVANASLRNVYSSCQVLILPSIEDGFGMVMAEALACGCPVIASMNTGAADLFTHGVEGFIVPIRDSIAIRNCLVQLADDRALASRMSAAAVERIARLGGNASYGENYMGVLKMLIRNKVKDLVHHQQAC